MKFIKRLKIFKKRKKLIFKKVNSKLKKLLKWNKFSSKKIKKWNILYKFIYFLIKISLKYTYDGLIGYDQGGQGSYTNDS